MSTKRNTTDALYAEAARAEAPPERCITLAASASAPRPRLGTGFCFSLSLLLG